MLVEKMVRASVALTGAFLSIAAPSDTYEHASISARSQWGSIRRNYPSSSELNATLFSSPTIAKIFTDYALPYDQLGATVFALLYGYAFPSYVSEFRGASGLQALGTNNIYNTGKLAAPGTNTIIRPNVDTIYAVSFTDLSEEDLVLTVPEMEQGRYYVFAFYDPYGDNYASVGSVHGNPAGQYLVRPSLGTGHAGLTTEECEEYEGYIDSPTLDGTLLIRVELKNNGTDLTDVNNYINSIQLNGTNKHSPTMSPLVPADFTNLSTSFPEQALQLTARLADRNPPQNQSIAKVVPSILEYAGIVNGAYQTPPSVNLTQAYTLLNSTLVKFYTSPDSKDEFANGWAVLSPTYIGSYENGTDVVVRAFVAETGYLANTPDQSIYPSPPKTVYSLSEDESLMITFGGGKPPLQSDGFWSLTIYDANGYLQANPQNVYSLGDRSKLTYADGTLVYDVNSTNSSSDSEPFQILVQASDEQPPSNWTGNWLPSPAGSGSFQLTLRFYAAEQPLQDGTYTYPAIENTTAILA